MGLRAHGPRDGYDSLL